MKRRNILSLVGASIPAACGVAVAKPERVIHIHPSVGTAFLEIAHSTQLCVVEFKEANFDLSYKVFDPKDNRQKIADSFHQFIKFLDPKFDPEKVYQPDIEIRVLDSADKYYEIVLDSHYYWQKKQKEMIRYYVPHRVENI